MFDNKKVLYGVGALLAVGILVALSLVFYHVGKNKGTDDCSSSGSALVDDASGVNASEPVDIVFSSDDNTANLNGATMINPTTLNCIVSRVNGNLYLSAVGVQRTPVTAGFAPGQRPESASRPIDLANAFAFKDLKPNKPIATLTGNSSRLGQIVSNLGKDKMIFATPAIVNYCGIISVPAKVEISNTGVVTVTTPGTALMAYGQQQLPTDQAFASTKCVGNGPNNLQFPGFWGFTSQLV